MEEREEREDSELKIEKKGTSNSFEINSAH